MMFRPCSREYGGIPSSPLFHSTSSLSSVQQLIARSHRLNNHDHRRSDLQICHDDRLCPTTTTPHHICTETSSSPPHLAETATSSPPHFLTSPKRPSWCLTTSVQRPTHSVDDDMNNDYRPDLFLFYFLFYFLFQFFFLLKMLLKHFFFVNSHLLFCFYFYKFSSF
jgi:hypothetical protein